MVLLYPVLTSVRQQQLIYIYNRGASRRQAVFQIVQDILWSQKHHLM